MSRCSSPSLVRRLVAAAGALALGACAGGDILDRSGQSVGPGSAASSAAGSGASAQVPVIADGATVPWRVIEGGKAARGCDASVAGRIGRSPLRRLSREEYDNTVRDLFGFDPGFSVTEDFPADGKAGPFPSNAAGSVDDTQTLRYQQAAERVSMLVAERLPTLLPCATAADSRCAEEFVRTIARKAYRRPLRADTLSGLMGVYQAGAEGGDFSAGVRLVVEALLQSPRFLYHMEAFPSAPGLSPLTGFELAERLSYFLWRTMPDEALSMRAQSGELETAEGLRAEAERMLHDPRADAAIASFTDHWLGIETAPSQQRDAARFPAFKPGFGEAARQETIAFVDHVLRDRSSDGSFETLLTANYSFPRAAVYDAYGVAPPAGYDGTTPLQLPGDRAGIVTQVSTLMVHSAATVSPIKRGVYVLNDLLCKNIQLPMNAQIPPPPPPVPGQSVRQRLEMHTRDPACMPCHLKINPIGFAFEGYDQIGRQVQTDDLGEPVNDRSELMLGDPSVDGPIEGAVQLADRILRSDSGRNCIIQQLHRFAVGRLEVPEDACSFVNLAQRFERSGDNVRELLLDLVGQDTFRFKSGG